MELYSKVIPTSSSAYKTERYAYIWKPVVQWELAGKKYHLEIDRTLFLYISIWNKQFTVVNFHAITKNDNLKLK
jgi:hypothetical protein